MFIVYFQVKRREYTAYETTLSGAISRALEFVRGIRGAHACVTTLDNKIVFER